MHKTSCGKSHLKRNKIVFKIHSELSGERVHDRSSLSKFSSKWAEYRDFREATVACLLLVNVAKKKSVIYQVLIQDMILSMVFALSNAFFVRRLSFSWKTKSG